MKNFILIILLVVLFGGCGSNRTIKSVTYDFQILNENPFSIYFPSDFIIKSELDQSDANYTATIYYFFHPKNRDCYYAVEALESKTNKADLMSLQNYILSKKIRMYQKYFEKKGYRLFQARTYQSHLGDCKTRKLKVTANKNGIERSLNMHILTRRNRVYLVTYQWDDNWDPEARRIFLKRVHTFKFGKR